MGDVVLYVRGEIDLSATPFLRQEFIDQVLRGDDSVVLDCSDMTFIDSSGIRLLAEMQTVLYAQGREMRIVHLHRTAARAINTLGLASALGVESYLPSGEVPAV